MEIFVRPDGTVKHVSVDEFATDFLGKKTVTRASNVEPVNKWLRVLFHVLRRVFGENGRCAAWTRRWPCLWQANLYLSGGPIFGPFQYRQDAVAAEVYWLNQQYANNEH
jgi:hypothetical protein